MRQVGNMSKKGLEKQVETLQSQLKQKQEELESKDKDVQDKIDKQVTSYPISQSPFAPLLKREITLRGEDVDVSARLDDGVAAGTLQKKEGEAAGSLTLEFDVQSWRLRRWIITDAVGIQTQVTLQNPVYDVSLANKLFAKPAYAVPADN